MSRLIFDQKLFFVRGVELIGASRASVFFNLVPLFGALFAVVFAGERFETHHGVGLALAIGGIAIAAAPARRQISLPAAVRPNSS